LATEYGHAWLGEIIRIAERFGHTVLDLSRDAATQERLFTALAEFQPDIMFLCSHGNESQFSGQNGEVVFTACHNDEVMAGNQAYYLSCLMGEALVPSMVSKGAVTVAGYVTEFVWVIDPAYVDDKLADPRAYPFMRAIVESSGRLLEGGSWQHFYDTWVAMCNMGVREWFERDDPTAPSIVAALEQDRDSLVVLGETSIRPVQEALARAMSPLPPALGVTLLALFL